MKRNLLYIFLVVLILIIPFVVASQGEFGGADQNALEVIMEIAPDYQPIAENIFVPASGEIESMLFTLQGAIGACFIGYYIGTKKKKSKATN